MTSLQARKTKLIFETADFVYECGHMRTVVIDARPQYAVIRLKGTRRGFSVPYAAIYHIAAKMAADAARAEKLRAKKKAGAR